jgi:Uma2 family endonuclease
MMMNTTIRFTYHDYLFLPDEKRAEIIDGDLIMEPSPGYGHQIVVKNIVKLLDRYIGLLKLGVVIPSPVDVILSEDNIVLPDVVFVAREHYGIIRKQIHGTPDLIVEVISTRHAGRDRELKMKLYAGHGVAEYWIADPETMTVEVYSLRRSKTAGRGVPLRRGMYYEVHGVFGPGSTVTSRLLRGFEALTDEIFSRPF